MYKVARRCNWPEEVLRRILLTSSLCAQGEKYFFFYFLYDKFTLSTNLSFLMKSLQHYDRSEKNLCKREFNTS